MIIATPVDPDGRIGHSWGKARTVAVGTVVDGQVTDWRQVEVGWDLVHDAGTHGSHHARVVTFLREHGVQVVAVDHVGDGMRRMLQTMGVTLVEGVHGPARQTVQALGGRVGPA